MIPNMGTPLWDINLKLIGLTSNAYDWLTVYTCLQLCTPSWIHMHTDVKYIHYILLLPTTNKSAVIV